MLIEEGTTKHLFHISTLSGADSSRTASFALVPLAGVTTMVLYLFVITMIVMTVILTHNTMKVLQTQTCIPTKPTLCAEKAKAMARDSDEVAVDGGDADAVSNLAFSTLTTELLRMIPPRIPHHVRDCAKTAGTTS